MGRKDLPPEPIGEPARSAGGGLPTAEGCARIVNPEGLHARPCHAIVSLAAEFESELEVSCGTLSVNGRSILALMTLSAPAGAELRFRARGEDAARLLARVTRLVASGFEERA